MVVEQAPSVPAELGAPVHPGEMLREDWLPDLGVTPYRLAKATGISLTHVYSILRGERGVTAETACRLAMYLGTTPEHWLRLQERYDLETARTPEFQAALEQIEPHPQVVVSPEQREHVLRGRKIPVVPPNRPVE